MVWKTEENTHRKDGILLMIEYIKFWLAQDIAFLIELIPLIILLFIGYLGYLIYIKWFNKS